MLPDGVRTNGVPRFPTKWTFSLGSVGKIVQHIAKWGNACARKTNYGKMLWICCPAVNTSFVPTLSGSRWYTHIYIYIYIYIHELWAQGAVQERAASAGKATVPAGCLGLPAALAPKAPSQRCDWARELSHDFRGIPRTFHLVKTTRGNNPPHEPLKQQCVCLTKSKEVWVMALIFPPRCKGPSASVSFYHL